MGYGWKPLLSSNAAPLFAPTLTSSALLASAGFLSGNASAWTAYDAAAVGGAAVECPAGQACEAVWLCSLQHNDLPSVEACAATQAPSAGQSWKLR